MQEMFHGLRQLALIAMIMRALLPAGWMPSTNPAAPITICTMDGALNHFPGNGPSNNAGNDKAPASHHAPCPYATAPHLAGAPALPVLFVPVARAQAAHTDPGAVPALGARFTPGSPRAPPLKV